MLTVITHTRFNRPEMLERCKLSVAKALPENAIHRVIHCPTSDDWFEKRYTDTIGCDYVAFVDDDDTIDPRSISLCLDAIKSTGAGIAFTNEVTVNSDLSVIGHHDSRKKYETIRFLPRGIHHLCVMKSELIDPSVLDMARNFKLGIDWFIKASVALSHNAVHVPYPGYFWTVHPGSYTVNTHKDFVRQIPEMTKKITERWGARSGYIDRYTTGL
jgi:hypothetical protein